MGAQCAAPAATQNGVEKEAQAHLDKHFPEGEVTKRLSAMLKQMSGQLFTEPSKHPVVANLGMIMLQCKAGQRHKQPVDGSNNYTDIPVMMRASHYVKFATAAYAGSKDEMMKILMGDGDEENTAGSLEMVDAYRSQQPQICPSYFIVLDAEKGRIVLSISGGPSVQDSISLAAGPSVPLLEGSANEAMLEMSRQVIAKTKEPLENALNASKNPSLTIIGHDSGGAVAILSMLQGFGSEVVEGLLPKNKVKCYTFGAPPVVFPGETPLPAHVRNNIFNFVNGMDCLPTISAGSVAKLLMAVRRVDEVDMSTPDRLQFLSGELETQEQFPDCEELPADMQSQFKCLPLVGTTVVFFKDARGKMVVTKLQKQQLDRVLIHENMFANHALSSYEESFDEALMQLQKSKGCC